MDASELKHIPFFAGVPEDELATLNAKLRPVSFDEGEAIITEGDEGDCCYVIESGKAGVMSRDIIGQEVSLATFGPTDHFGQIALVTTSKRTATVRALEPVQAYALYREDFAALEQACPEFAARVRSGVDLLAVDTFLQKASPFAHLSDEAVHTLATQMYSESVAPGTEIVRQGDEGDRFYLVRSGEVEVIKDGARIQTLRPGDCFGEIALLATVPRTATVRSLNDVQLLSLTKPQFDAVLEENTVLKRQFGEFVRIRAGAEMFKSLVTNADPLATLMPNVSGDQRQRYWWFLSGGLALFGLLSYLAVRFDSPFIVLAAISVGSMIGPVVYVTYLTESHLLPDNPINLAITFLFAAAIGVPLAIVAENAVGARHGALIPSFLVAIIEEAAKIVGVAWRVRRSSARFQMDGVVYGAAAGMGFAAFENVLYGISQAASVRALLSTLWLRTVLSPFGHGTWTAIISGAIWSQKERGSGISLGLVGAWATSITLHALWDWQPLNGYLALVWMVVIGLVGLTILKDIVDNATKDAAEAIVALNPEAAVASGGQQVSCRSCGQMSPRGTHYCVRCGAVLTA